jgi:hypothetical protein
LNRPEGWSIASCRADGNTPCIAMGLITATAAGKGATAWQDLPAKERSWRPRFEAGDLCLKRELYVEANSESPCREHDGCMEC